MTKAELQQKIEGLEAGIKRLDQRLALLEAQRFPYTTPPVVTPDWGTVPWLGVWTSDGAAGHFENDVEIDIH